MNIRPVRVKSKAAPKAGSTKTARGKAAALKKLATFQAEQARELIRAAKANRTAAQAVSTLDRVGKPAVRRKSTKKRTTKKRTTKRRTSRRR